MTHVLDPDALSDDARLLAPPLPPFSDITRTDASFRAFLHGLPGVDQVGAEARAAYERVFKQDSRTLRTVQAAGTPYALVTEFTIDALGRVLIDPERPSVAYAVRGSFGGAPRRARHSIR